MVLESQTGELVFFITSMGAYVVKAKEKSNPWTLSYHGVVVVSSTCSSNKMLVV